MLRTNDRDGVRIIELCPRIDIHNVFEVEEEITSLIDPAHLKVVIDFAGVEYFGSNGIRILMLCKRKLEKLGGKLVLVRLSPFVVKILTAIDLLEIFTIHETVDDALRAFA